MVDKEFKNLFLVYEVSNLETDGSGYIYYQKIRTYPGKQNGVKDSGKGTKMSMHREGWCRGLAREWQSYTWSGKHRITEEISDRRL